MKSIGRKASRHQVRVQAVWKVDGKYRRDRSFTVNIPQPIEEMELYGLVMALRQAVESWYRDVIEGGDEDA